MKKLLLVITAAAALVLGVEAPVAADVDDFRFESFDATYDLATDGEGRSVVRIEETLVAVFPDSDQNRGIRRELVERYDGHPTDLEVVSVEDEEGTPRSFETESVDEFLVLTIAADDFVRGEQTYVISYEQHNVTRYFENTDSDEFYWDTNGTGWAQPFGRATATVNVAPDLVPAMTGNADAASGREGDDGPAEIAPTDDGYVFTATDLAPGENLSFAIGFEPGTFVARDDSFGATPFTWLALVSALAAIGTVIGAFVLRRTRLRDAPGRGIIIAEYVSPKGVSVPLSSVVLGAAATAKATTAQILDLAIAGNLRVIDESATRKPAYRLEYLGDAGVDADGRDSLHALFGQVLTHGESRSLKKANAKTVKAFAALMKRVTERATSDGYRRKVPTGRIAAVFGLAIAAAAAAFVFSAISLEGSYGGMLPVLFMIVGAVGAVVVGILLFRTPLDARGVELRDYLRGLKVYIALAEADRLRYLQSPQGAMRVPVAVDDPAEVVKLNEKLLPYAVLFGQEKEWAGELGRYYEQQGTQPDWYYGHGAFNAALFASAISSVSTSVSSYSSSTGGSSGGVSSGGGGGGGGGGGV